MDDSSAHLTPPTAEALRDFERPFPAPRICRLGDWEVVVSDSPPPRPRRPGEWVGLEAVASDVRLEFLQRIVERLIVQVAGQSHDRAPDPRDELRRAAYAEELKGDELVLVKLLSWHGGSVPLKDLAVACEWDVGDNLANIHNQWNSLRRRLNDKLRRHGWEVVRRDNHAVVRRVGPGTKAKQN